VEQIGTEADCSGPAARYYAWYELYPGASQNFAETVQPGDDFTGTVTYLGQDTFSLSIADTTLGWNQSTQASLDQAPALSSAEVIAEAPCCTASGGALPLADFGTVSFTDATVNGSPIGSAGGLEQVAMVNDSSAALDAVSELAGGEAFSATWLSSS
jgi:hypothetical protein